jgi:hypothetical protein
MTEQNVPNIEALQSRRAELLAIRDAIDAELADIERQLAEQPKHYVLDAEPGSLSVTLTS